MKELVDLVQKEAEYLGDGIVKVDGFINHQLLPGLTNRMGVEFKRLMDEAGVTGVTRIITAEVSGIAPALATAAAYDVPVVFARKKRPVTMADHLYHVTAPSHTKGGEVDLYLSSKYLNADDKVLLIDDFLASGSTILAMMDLIAESGAELLGVGCVLEKVFEPGRSRVQGLTIPLVSLAKIDMAGEEGFNVF